MGSPGYYDLLETIRPYRDDIAKLKRLSARLTKKEKGYLLFYSILKNLDVDFLRWLIKSGADVNVMPCGETPLMAAVRYPNVMQLLIDSGADITVKNRFGKNVLFYAVQFGNIDVVRILLNNGGKDLINSQIDSQEETNETGETYKEILGIYIHPTTVHGFTPLVYAKRYASREIIELLIKNGAHNGPADNKKIKNWIKEGPLDL